MVVVAVEEVEEVEEMEEVDEVEEVEEVEEEEDWIGLEEVEEDWIGLEGVVVFRCDRFPHGLLTSWLCYLYRTSTYLHPPCIAHPFNPIQPSAKSGGSRQRTPRLTSCSP